MPTFDAYEKAMSDALKNVAGIKHVEEYANDLSPSTLKKVALRDSGILMVPLGGMPSREQPATGQLAFDCRTGAFIVTRNARGSIERTRQARKLAREVMLMIQHNQWGLADVHGAAIEKLENRSSGKVDNEGFAIWLVVWKQTIYLDEELVDTSVVPTDVHVASTAGSSSQVVPS